MEHISSSVFYVQSAKVFHVSVFPFLPCNHRVGEQVSEPNQRPTSTGARRRCGHFHRWLHINHTSLSCN